MDDLDARSDTSYLGASQFGASPSSSSSSFSSVSGFDFGSETSNPDCCEDGLIRKLKVLIVSVEYTMLRPEKELGDVVHADIAKGVFDPPAVPVISIFGITLAGQKTCMHVHGVMPYIFVECPEALLNMVADDAIARNRYLSNLSTSIDDEWRALSHRPEDLSKQIVQRIEIVRGTPFYGYCDADPSRAHLFLKISLFDPAQTRRVANILRSGVKVWSSLVRFAPYEVHLPYLLQFFVDYNLVGMDSIVVDELFVRFRGHLPTTESHILWTAPTNRSNSGGSSSSNHNGNDTGCSDSQRFKSSARLQHLPGGHFSPTPASLSAAVAQSDGPDRFYTLSPAILQPSTTKEAGSRRGTGPTGSPRVYWTTENTPQVMRNNFPRRSWCDLEIDVSARGILNPRSLGNQIARATSIEKLFAAQPNLISTARHIWNKQEKQARQHGYAWNPPEPLMSDRVFREVEHEHQDEKERMFDELREFLASAELTQLPPAEPSSTCQDDCSSQRHSVYFDEEEDLEILGGMVESDDNEDLDEAEDDDDAAANWKEIVESSQRYIEQLDENSQSSASPVVVDVERQAMEFRIPQLDGQHDHLFDEISSEDDDDDDGKMLPHMSVLWPRRGLQISKSGEIIEDPIMPVEESTILKPVGRFTPFIQRRPSSFVSRFSDHLITHNEGHPSLRLGNGSGAARSFYLPPANRDRGARSPTGTRRSSDSNGILRSRMKLDGSSSRDAERRILRELSPRSTLHGRVCEKKKLEGRSHERSDSTKRKDDSVSSRRERTKERRKHNEADKKDGAKDKLLDSGKAKEKKKTKTQKRRRRQAEDRQPITNVEQSCDFIEEAEQHCPALSPSQQLVTAVELTRLKINKAMRFDVVFPQGKPAFDPGQWLSPAKQPPLEEIVDELQITARAAASALQAGAASPTTTIPLSKEMLTVLSIEILAASRPGLLPDPVHDPVLAVCYAIRDYRMASIIGESYADLVGLLIVGELPSHTFGAQVAVDRFPTEKDLFAGLGALVREYDPDILLSYELELSSLAYLIERGLPPSYLSRLQKVQVERRARRSQSSDEEDRDVSIPGRILINLWRVMRSEVALRSYSLNAVVAEVLKERLPDYSADHLSACYLSDVMVEREFVLKHLLTRTMCNLRLLDNKDILNRTSEQARVFGIDFSSVLTRGTQYRVESLLFRLTKLMNFVLVSPSKAELRAQKAVFCVPLVMEPISRFYTDPVIVLDFQSLYPSIVIAYNLCYSTCLGALRDIIKLNNSGTIQLGAQNYRVGLTMLKRLYEQRALFITDNGVLFVKSNHGDPERDGRRFGVLPRLLLELLEARVMVKAEQKLANNEHLKTQMNACQTALKLILNVTYGYTGAIQTGRMPCADLADSIVQQARVTLEGAIRFVEREWPGAKVVYGDTDSLFVQLPGKTRKEAFEIGAEIAEAVTKRNPAPIKLQFEKVYQPCVLVSKKHYCGYAYTSPEQREPVFDAKGIETVRRDSCALVSQTVRQALDLYFTSGDIDRVKLLVQRTFTRLFLGKLPLNLLFTAREVRLGAYRPGKEPAHAKLCQRLQRVDPRRIALYGERVPYVVVCLDKNASLTDAVRSPDELLKNPRLRINCTYYIEKQLIPPLQRIFALEPAAANVGHWYSSLPRSLLEGWLQVGRSSLIASYFLPTRCSICKSVDQDVKTVGKSFAFCRSCLSSRTSYWQLITEQNRVASSLHQVRQICRGCANDAEMKTCCSLDCPIFFTRLSLRNRVAMQAKVCSAFLTVIGGET